MDLRRSSMALAALALVACETSGTPAATIDPVVTEGLDAVVDAAVAEGFAGQIAIMRNGEFVYARAAGFADREGKIPVTETTLFHVASLTKYFTAAMTLMAVDEGRIRLTDRAPDLFPKTPIALREFALVELLSHRSGLRSTYAAEEESTAEAAVIAIAEANKDNLPDGGFRYSNDGYDLLAILLERSYGERYETIFTENIAQKAGLKHFDFWGEAALEDPRVRGQPLDPQAPELMKRNYGMLGSAGLLITAAELAKWQAALTSGYILSEASLSEMYAPRASLSIGAALFGSFLINSPRLREAVSARGSEDWGDNAYLNHYRDCGLIVAVVTSRGPAEGSGKPLFRDSLIESVETSLAGECAAR